MISNTALVNVDASALKELVRVTKVPGEPEPAMGLSEKSSFTAIPAAVPEMVPELMVKSWSSAAERYAETGAGGAGVSMVPMSALEFTL